MVKQKPQILSRSIPKSVKQRLRQEVGFGCPAKDCGNPYLEYHHFDPPWSVEKHHDPERMIALCSEHHGKANAWTVDQVRAMKDPDPNRTEVQGRIEWMRHDILAVVGGNFYYETPIIFELDGQPVVWFERDEKRHLLLNISMDMPGGKPRTSLTNNDWIIRGDPTDVESPPNGSRLSVAYPGGDFLKIQFKEYLNLESLSSKYPCTADFGASFEFPIVVAQVELKIGHAGVHLAGNKTLLPGNNVFQGMFSTRCGVGLSVRSEKPRAQCWDGINYIVDKYSHLLS